MDKTDIEIIETEEDRENTKPQVEVPDPAQQILDLKDQLLRALAENENIRKRSQKDKDDALKYGVSNLARDVIGVVDNLQRVLDNKSGDPSEISEALFTGVDLILKDLDSIFTRHGIQRIDAHEKPFDPHQHQAVFEQETDEHAPGTIVQVIQDGYNIHGRLLRPAMVAVAKAKNHGAA